MDNHITNVEENETITYQTYETIERSHIQNENHTFMNQEKDTSQFTDYTMSNVTHQPVSPVPQSKNRPPQTQKKMVRFEQIHRFSKVKGHDPASSMNVAGVSGIGASVPTGPQLSVHVPQLSLPEDPTKVIHHAVLPPKALAPLKKKEMDSRFSTPSTETLFNFTISCSVMIFVGLC